MNQVLLVVQLVVNFTLMATHSGMERAVGQEVCAVNSMTHLTFEKV